MFEIGGKHFEWDIEKNIININKHGVSFKEAATAFIDENAIEIDDYDHSYSEERFILIGRSKKLRLLVVCHCHKENEIIRIISARKANNIETEEYELGGKE